MSSIEIREIAHDSALYHETVNLRYDLLRKPLGLEFTENQLKEEVNDVHLAALVQGKVVACLILSFYLPDKVKLRQMAVHSKCQGKGIGHLLLVAAEDIARKKACQMVFLHARKDVSDFYQKAGFQLVGEPFIEVMIPHVRMEKILL